MWLSRNKEHKDAQDQGAAELQAIRQSMAMIEFTPDGIILDANPAFLGVVNYRLEEIVGKHHRLFCSRNLSESLAYQQFWQRLRQGEHFSDRFPRLTQDGKEVWLEATYMPIRDDQGSVTKVMKIATDITRQVAAEHMHESYIKAIDRSMAVIEFNLEGEVVSATRTSSI
ncbi:PAS domain-containing protein [Ectopseudomonas toyotomiensis]|uniref:PAS domain-containing protein n=1 Tax=Ectopseudomonas toyotomiensis TaxID=554344 RepID=UPI0037C89EA5